MINNHWSKNTRCQIPDARYQMPDGSDHYLVPSIWNQLFKHSQFIHMFHSFRELIGVIFLQNSEIDEFVFQVAEACREDGCI